MSTIDGGHLEVSDGGQEGPEEAGLVGRREAVDLHAGGGSRGLGLLRRSLRSALSFAGFT